MNGCFTVVQGQEKWEPHQVVPVGVGKEHIVFEPAFRHELTAQPPDSGSRIHNNNTPVLGPDFQARRMNLRYRAAGSNKPVYPHTLNGSALATSRLMVALIENYQTPERRGMIPKALMPYMNGLDQIRGINS